MYSFPNLIEIEDSAVINSYKKSQFDIPYSNRNYIDLRHLEDDRTVLRNPHKGWYWHYIDNGYKRGNYRVEHDPADRLEDFPGLNHLYLRFDWGDIEVEEGKYDWSYIDKIMEEWTRYGYRFGIRICTYEGDGAIPFATPEYVFRKGARAFSLSHGRLQPDYGDPIYLDALSRMMEEAGRKFNNDKRIELVDVGTFGTWGEGHTGNGTGVIYPTEVLKKHIDLHTKNFPDKFVILNDDHINSRWAADSDGIFELIDYASSHGLGLDDDSVCVDGYARDYGYNSLRTPWLFDYFWENAPVILEFEHYMAVPAETFRNGLPFIDAMQRTHANYAGFHGYPRPWLEREPYLTEYCANRLGYWYFVPGIEISPLTLGIPNVATLYIENRGYTHAYYRYQLKIMLEGEDNQRFIQDVSDADNRTWETGKITKQKAEIRPTGIEPGNYDLYIGLFEGDTPIQLGIKSETIKEGMYKLCSIPVTEI